MRELLGWIDRSRQITGWVLQMLALRSSTLYRVIRSKRIVMVGKNGLKIDARENFQANPSSLKSPYVVFVPIF